jgi:epoxyqueuosine reductase
MLGMEYAAKPVTGTGGRVAAYARGPDYHRYVWDRLNELSAWLDAEVPGTYSHGVTDTAPLLERDFARRAGLGWVGKNTMLINTERGSFFFLAALLTTLELRPDTLHTTSHCGTCTACLEACPTQAFPEPGVLDARRCVSYLTIELRGPIPEELRPGVGDRLFGCDVCQDVCPWNRHAANGAAAFPNDPRMATLDPVELLSLSEGEFRRRFRGTSLFRTRRSGLLRNAAIVLGNIGTEENLRALQKAADDADPVIAEAARWAIGQIRRRASSRLPPAQPDR